MKKGFESTALNDLTGELTPPGIYLFAILNSLLDFFILHPLY